MRFFASVSENDRVNQRAGANNAQAAPGRRGSQATSPSGVGEGPVGTPQQKSSPSALVLTTSYPRFPGDPAGHFVESEVRQLRTAGTVSVLVPAPAGSAPGTTLGQHGERVRWLPAGELFGAGGALPRLRAVPSRALALPGFLLAARRALREEPPVQRVVAHWLVPWGAPLLGWVRLAPGAHVEVVVHGSDARLLLALPWPLADAFVRRLVRLAPRVRCVSEELRATLAKRFPALVRDAVVEPSPIDVSAAPSSRAVARLLLGLPPARPGARRLAVVVARLVDGKRVDVALRAAALIPRLDVVVVGDGPLRGELEAAFPSVRFVGAVPRPQALAYLAAADLLLCSSRVEGAPTVVREARALDVPVVAVAAGDLVEWAQRDRGLWVVD